MSSCGSYRLANFALLPTISQHRLLTSPCFLYLVRSAPVCTSMNSRLHISLFLRKEVIQPHLPIRLPCYDFTPIICPTFGGWLPKGLPHRLRVLQTLVV